MLSGRPDAGELALRLVGAGLWSQTATGWAIVQQRREVSEAKARAGRLGGLRSGVVRAKRSADEAERSTPLPASEAPAAVPDTTYAGARQNSDSEFGKTQKTTTAVSGAREAAKTEAPKAVAASLALNPEGKRLLILMARESRGAFNLDAHLPLRVDLANRFVAARLDDETVCVMARLCAKPKTVWGWSTKLAPLPITVAWLLGKVSDDGTRTGAPLACLIAVARESVRRERANAEARQRAVDDANEARRKRAESLAQKGAPPPVVSAESVRAALASAPFGTSPATIERIANAARRNVAA